MFVNFNLFLFYAPTLMIAQFDFDIFLSGFIIGFSSLLAYPFCYFTITKVRRRVMGIINLGIVLISSLILVFIWNPRSAEVESSDLENIVELILFFVISFFTTS